MLEQCIELFSLHGDSETAPLLHAALDGPALQRPLDFKGPPALHMYRLSLSRAQRQKAYDDMRIMSAAGLTTAATRSRGLGGFVEAWAEYVAVR